MKTKKALRKARKKIKALKEELNSWQDFAGEMGDDKRAWYNTASRLSHMLLWEMFAYESRKVEPESYTKGG